VFANPEPSILAEVIKTALGLDFDVQEMKKTGEKIYTMKRLFNLKMGLTPADETLPEILLKPLDEGGSAGKSPDFEKLKKAFYEYRDWNLKTGYPSQEKLKELGLADLL
jgi:aldehyde:ferredoxin oxidoreductase